MELEVNVTPMYGEELSGLLVPTINPELFTSDACALYPSVGNIVNAPLEYIKALLPV